MLSEELVKAIIGALATVTVAAFALYGVIRQSRKPDTSKTPVTGNTGEALDTFSGTQNEFMALVIADNKSLRTDLATLTTSVQEIKTHQETFVTAVRRYLIKLAASWGREATMPWPDDLDFHILEETLPNTGNHRKEP